MSIDPEDFAVPFCGAPVYLLADSQLLFSSPGGRPLLAPAVDAIESAEPRAAYVGAANGDRPEYYSIFEGAMEMIGVRDRRMILAGYSARDRAYLRSADLIVLAGGDVGAGLRVLFSAHGLPESIVKRGDPYQWQVERTVAAVAMIVRGHSALNAMPSSRNSSAIPSVHMLMPYLAMV